MELNQDLIQYKLAAPARAKLLGGIAAGVVGLVLNFGLDPVMGWKTVILAAFLSVTVGLFGLFAMSIQYLSGAHWGVAMRRVPENMSRMLIVGGGLAILVAIGFFVDRGHIQHVYEWANAEVVAKDKILTHKSAWLSVGSMAFRIVLFVALWNVFGAVFRKWSAAQDKDGDLKYTFNATKLSAAFIIVFALSYSFFGVDLLMSVNPHWYSTMWGVYVFAGLNLSGFAVTFLLIDYLKRQGKFGQYVNENHVHDLGKFMFGFTVFYAYIAFSQFMLIWYASIPEETSFYEGRTHSVGGLVMTLALVFTRFLVPFFGLVNRPSKRDSNHVRKIAWVIVASQVIDVCWILFFGTHGGHHAEGVAAYLPIVGILLAVGGVISLVALVTLKGLEKNPLLPVKDPRLEASLHHHQ